jgi:hypothetical protein
MQMRNPIKIHPDLRPVLEQLAARQGRDPVDVVIGAIQMYTEDAATQQAPESNSIWDDWPHDDEEATYSGHSLPDTVSLALTRRAKADGVDYLRVIDRALRYYFEALGVGTSFESEGT